MAELDEEDKEDNEEDKEDKEYKEEMDEGETGENDEKADNTMDEDAKITAEYGLDDYDDGWLIPLYAVNLMPCNDNFLLLQMTTMFLWESKVWLCLRMKTKIHM